MKICRICGEEYQEEHENCAYCGCPEDWSSKQNWEFPEEIREVVILFFFQEISQKEIARMMGIKLSLVKYRVSRAKKLLAKYLGEGE